MKITTRRLWSSVLLILATATVEAGEWEGSLQWLRRVELSTPVSGVVSRVLVEAGERVRAGQVLMRLDQRGLKAELGRVQAELERLTRTRDEAEREYDRAMELYDRTLLSEHELELAKIARATALAEFQSAQAAVTRAALELEYSEVRAPFDGVVLRRNVEPGQTIVTRLQTSPLLVLAETGRMVAAVRLPLGEISQLSEGDEATVHVGGADLKGKVRRLGLEPDGEDRSYLLEVLFDTAGKLFRAGQGVGVRIP